MQAKKARLRDVAQLCGVSIATVSNVVNRRHKVAEPTRIKVEFILRQLDYRPNEHALALRRQSLIQRLAPEADPEVGPAQVPDPGGHGEGHDCGDDASEGQLPVGDRVMVRLSDGQVLHGTVDAVMPDGSGFWVWCVGLGRRFVLQQDNPDVSTFHAENGSAQGTVRMVLDTPGLTGLPTPFI